MGQVARETPAATARPARPLLRGWFHAGAALGAVTLTGALCWRTRLDPPRLLSMLIFGLSLIQLYVVSAVFHIGRWRPRPLRVLQSVDHANIFVVIAGTYTPLCFNILTGWLRAGVLTTIWALAAAGLGLSVFAARIPRWAGTGLYIGMGWVSILIVPAFVAAVGWLPVLLLMAGGVLNTVGAVVYARRRPDPFPRILGFHEVFHLFVIAGSAAFATVIWIWVVPFPRV